MLFRHQGNSCTLIRRETADGSGDTQQADVAECEQAWWPRLLKRQSFSDRAGSSERFARTSLQEEVTIGIEASDQNFERILFRINYESVRFRDLNMNTFSLNRDRIMIELEVCY